MYKRFSFPMGHILTAAEVERLQTALYSVHALHPSRLWFKLYWECYMAYRHATDGLRWADEHLHDRRDYRAVEKTCLAVALQSPWRFPWLTYMELLGTACEQMK
jgi:hypothetical protein